jgi:hypothetical protein
MCLCHKQLTIKQIGNFSSKDICKVVAWLELYQSATLTQNKFLRYFIV